MASLNWVGNWSSGSLQYVYSGTQNNGQITQMVDTASGETVSYQYDALKRLVSAGSVPNAGSSVPAWTQAYQYDGFGNLTGKTLNGTPTAVPVDGTTNRLVNASYDANGNMTSGVGTSFSYDAENRISSAGAQSGGTVYYGYSPDNKRICMMDTMGYVQWTLYGARGERLGTYDPNGFSLNTVWFAGKLINENAGVANSSYDSEVFTDRLGSNRAGARFYPYGEEIGTPTTNNRVKFGTYFRDGYTGLDYADQRFYASSYGRFNTADSYGGSAAATNPSTWNRYSYSLGDPVNRMDPDGSDSCGVWQGTWTGALGTETWYEGGVCDYGVSTYGHAPPQVAVTTAEWDDVHPVQTQGKGGTFLHIVNTSKGGAQQQRITDVLDWIQGNIDPKCAGWLSGIGGAITGLEGDPNNPDSVAIGHGAYDVGVSAFTGNDPVHTDLPPGYAIAVNDIGAFFTSTVSGGGTLSVAGYTGGTGQAQVFILLHEFGHLLGAAGFQDDFGSNKAGTSNDNLVKKNCQTTLNAARNIP